MKKKKLWMTSSEYMFRQQWKEKTPQEKEDIAYRWGYVDFWSMLLIGFGMGAFFVFLLAQSPWYVKLLCGV